MNTMERTLERIILVTELYLGDPMGMSFWDSVDDGNEDLYEPAAQTFLAVVTNYRIGRSW
jgi:hypothetical protein